MFRNLKFPAERNDQANRRLRDDCVLQETLSCETSVVPCVYSALLVEHFCRERNTPCV